AVGHAGRAAVAACRCSLDLHVKVAKDWQRDPRQLRKLGF
ncbi:GTPase Era, partial [Streptomyces canus]